MTDAKGPLNTQAHPGANRWYNKYRWAGWLYPITAICLLLLLPTAPLRGDDLIVIPTLAEYNSWDPDTQRRFDWSLGGINVSRMIQAGELIPGQAIDTKAPPINMTIQLYRWIEMWSGAQRQSSVDYQELLQWRKFTKAVEDCDSWLENQRRFGANRYGFPLCGPNSYFASNGSEAGTCLPYPTVIDAGVPFYDTYTPEPILDPLTPTFTIVRPWLWGVR